MHSVARFGLVGRRIGIMKLSDQSIPPESGIANRMSGLSRVIWATSPDHANAAARLPAPRSFDVLVAVEAVDLPVVDRLLELVERGLRGRRTSAWSVSAPSEHEQADGVAHLGEHRLRARHGEEVVDRLDLLAAVLLDVVRDAGHAGRPRRAVLARRVERRVLRARLGGSPCSGTSPRRTAAPTSTWLIMRFAIQSVSTKPSRPMLWSLREVRPDLGEVLVVVVDVLGVGELDPGVLRGSRFSDWSVM